MSTQHGYKECKHQRSNKYSNYSKAIINGMMFIGVWRNQEISQVLIEVAMWLYAALQHNSIDDSECQELSSEEKIQ